MFDIYVLSSSILCGILLILPTNVASVKLRLPSVLSKLYAIFFSDTVSTLPIPIALTAESLSHRTPSALFPKETLLTTAGNP